MTHKSPPIGNLHLLAALLVSLFAAPALASHPLALTHQTQITIDLRLSLTVPGARPVELREQLRGLAGEKLALAKQIESSRVKLLVGLTLIAEPDEATAECGLELESEVRADGLPPTPTHRRVTVGAGRLWIADLWSDESRGSRLVLAATVHWETVPFLAPIEPGAEPVDLMIGVYQKRKGKAHLLERHRLSSIVGSPVEYRFHHQPGPGSRAIPGTLVVEILPKAMDQREVTLQVTVRHEGKSPYSELPSLHLSVLETLVTGASVDLPLPGRDDQPELLFRITPFF